MTLHGRDALLVILLLIVGGALNSGYRSYSVRWFGVGEGGTAFDVVGLDSCVYVTGGLGSGDAFVYRSCDGDEELLDLGVRGFGLRIAPINSSLYIGGKLRRGGVFLARVDVFGGGLALTELYGIDVGAGLESLPYIDVAAGPSHIYLLSNWERLGNVTALIASFMLGEDGLKLLWARLLNNILVKSLLVVGGKLYLAGQFHGNANITDIALVELAANGTPMAASIYRVDGVLSASAYMDGHIYVAGFSVGNGSFVVKVDPGSFRPERSIKFGGGEVFDLTPHENRIYLTGRLVPPGGVGFVARFDEDLNPEAFYRFASDSPGYLFGVSLLEDAHKNLHLFVAGSGASAMRVDPVKQGIAAQNINVESKTLHTTPPMTPAKPEIKRLSIHYSELKPSLGNIVLIELTSSEKTIVKPVKLPSRNPWISVAIAIGVLAICIALLAVVRRRIKGGRG